MQDPAFVAALRACGQSPVTMPGGLTVLRRRLFGLPVAMLPRAAPPPDLGDQLACAGLHRIPMILSPEAPCPMPRAFRLRAPMERAILPLSPTPEDQIASAHSKWRNQWRRALAQKLTLTHARLPADAMHPLLVAEDTQRRTRGYAGWPAPLTAAFANAAPHQTLLITARDPHGILAQMLFLTHGRQATYQIGHTTDRGRAAHAHNLILMAACTALAKRGIDAIDLGPLDPRTPDLNRFKLRSGAHPAPTGGTWLRFRPLARGPRP